VCEPGDELHCGFLPCALVWELRGLSIPSWSSYWDVSLPLPRLFIPFSLTQTNRYNKSIWVTEYAYNNQSLSDTQNFFNTSAQYFDRLSNIERYSYFGSFRSSVSNVGPNAAMLTQNGLLTDIGSWYLGGAATNNIPSSQGGAASVKANAWFAGAVAVVGLFIL